VGCICEFVFLVADLACLDDVNVGRDGRWQSLDPALARFFGHFRPESRASTRVWRMSSKGAMQSSTSKLKYPW
jgi:hypothetical protein